MTGTLDNRWRQGITSCYICYLYATSQFYSCLLFFHEFWILVFFTDLANHSLNTCVFRELSTQHHAKLFSLILHFILSSDKKGFTNKITKFCGKKQSIFTPRKGLKINIRGLFERKALLQLFVFAIMLSITWIMYQYLLGIHCIPDKICFSSCYLGHQFHNMKWVYLSKACWGIFLTNPTNITIKDIYEFSSYVRSH